MNPKYLSVRVDRQTGDLWLTDERRGKPIKKIANITAPVLLALSAELTSVDNSTGLSRDVRFSDGTAIRVSVTLIEETSNDDSATAATDPAEPGQAGERADLQRVGVDEGLPSVGVGAAAVPGLVGVFDYVPPSAPVGD